MKEKQIKVLDMIAADMENDAKEFDGKPFTGKTMAEYNGNQGAAIAALAGIMKEILESDCKENKRLKSALQEITEGKGRYSMDKLTHASNTIDDMKKIAKDALKEQK